jgi:hypothetical protein
MVIEHKTVLKFESRSVASMSFVLSHEFCVDAGLCFLDFPQNHPKFIFRWQLITQSRVVESLAESTRARCEDV